MTNVQAITAAIAQELREHPERWIQDKFARTKSGTVVPPESPEAICWCLAGHLRRHGIYSDNDIYRKLLRLTNYDSIPSWNDAPHRTVADVIALCEQVAKS